jgi:SAM-dependent methyltransferase
MGEATSTVSPASAEAGEVARAAMTPSSRPASVADDATTVRDDQPTVIDDRGNELHPGDVPAPTGRPSPVAAPPLDDRRPASAPATRPRPSRMRPLLRRQSGRPEEFYRYLAQDTVRQLRQHLTIEGARAVDIGGGPGYVAEELHTAGARSCVISSCRAAIVGRRVDAAVLGDSGALPLAADSMQIVHSANVLEHVSLPYSMLAEMVRVLEPRDGIGYLTFTNWYSPRGHEPPPWPTRGTRRLDPRVGAPLQTDYPLHVSDVLRWFETRRDIDVLWSGPRYLPPWLRWIVAVPGMREAFSWNLVVVFRKRRRR